jgi:predicted RNase H-like HicB family nuclease
MMTRPGQATMELRVRVHHEEGSYWAEVVELPGCFASGDTFDELLESLREAIGLYLEERGPAPAAPSLEVEEITVAMSPPEPQPA